MVAKCSHRTRKITAFIHREKAGKEEVNSISHFFFGSLGI